MGKGYRKNLERLLRSAWEKSKRWRVAEANATDPSNDSHAHPHTDPVTPQLNCVGAAFFANVAKSAVFVRLSK